ncbi:MAG TPA: TrkH family potassium uptake protein [Candidatus Hydrogenedentes bacterium]|nr:TrkH family potassium uptake protein [Candidatus Hydrogenedentota bacterium]
MNHLAVIKNLGLFSMALCVLYLPSLCWALWFWETEMLAAFFQSAAVVLFIGGLMLVVGRRARSRLLNRETLALVGVGWLVIAAYGALPFVFSGTLSFVDAYFESMSGFTTTGATVLTDIEATPKSLLFWRSFTHWLGGLGIILLIIIVLPFLGAGGKLLYRSEVPGLDKQGLRPRIKDSALILFKIYAALTVLMTLLLTLAGMDLFEAFCHTFGTLATGGFSTRNASIAAYDSVIIEAIIVVFMIIAGTSFGLLYCLSQKDWRKILGNSEWRLYMAILGISAALIAANLLGMQGTLAVVETDGHATHISSVFTSVRMAVFQTVSIMTTTGYCTADFDAWPYFSRSLMVLLMFIGASSGSTGGGLKVVRIMILGKLIRHHLERTFRPKHIRVMRVDRMTVNEEVQRSVLSYFLIYIAVAGLSVVYLSGLGLPAETSFTSVVATLNNIGPGLELVGAVENYAFIPVPGKILLSLLMAMGRLELYAICVLFVPSFWRRA